MKLVAPAQYQRLCTIGTVSMHGRGCREPKSLEVRDEWLYATESHRKGGSLFEAKGL